MNDLCIYRADDEVPLSYSASRQLAARWRQASSTSYLMRAAETLLSLTWRPWKLLLTSMRWSDPQVGGSAALTLPASCSLTQNTAVVWSRPIPAKVLLRTMNRGTRSRKWLVSSTSGSAFAQRRISTVVISAWLLEVVVPLGTMSDIRLVS